MALNRIKSLALVVVLLSSVAAGATFWKAEQHCSMADMECCKAFKDLKSVDLQAPAEMPCCTLRGPEPLSDRSSGSLRVQPPVQEAQDSGANHTPHAVPRDLALDIYSIRVKPPGSQPSYIRNLSLLI